MSKQDLKTKEKILERLKELNDYLIAVTENEKNLVTVLHDLNKRVTKLEEK